ncbi:MAG: hypothetical protein NVS4B12_27310 [Ktedonobacteraceae bacterium]
MQTKTAVPQAVIELVKRFDRNRSTYRSERYNEAQLRVEFLNPLFEALGRDITNKQGYAEAYKDVINEDAMVALLNRLYKCFYLLV